MSIRTAGDGPVPMPGKAQLVLSCPEAISRDRVRTVFGRVMGLVAVTLGFMALGAYIGRDLSGEIGIAFFVASFACICDLNIASPGPSETGADVSVRGRTADRTGARSGPERIRPRGPGCPLASGRGNGSVCCGIRSGWLRDPPQSVLGGTDPVLGAAGRDRVRNCRAIRLDSERERDLVGGRPRDLRSIHDLQFQSAASNRNRERGSDRREHLPRHRQRVPILPGDIGRPRIGPRLLTDQRQRLETSSRPPLDAETLDALDAPRRVRRHGPTAADRHNRS